MAPLRLTKKTGGGREAPGRLKVNLSLGSLRARVGAARPSAVRQQESAEPEAPSSAAAAATRICCLYRGLGAYLRWGRRATGRANFHGDFVVYKTTPLGNQHAARLFSPAIHSGSATCLEVNCGEGLVVYNEGHVSSLGDKRRVAIRDIKMGMDVSRAAHDARVN
mmetsp:Transcript_61677/g.139630  ORF Transcript_61677/g.139630 Transcript_61677/m.139630 type:complete len:165 (+) Transcript_61677:441-935(+)